MAQYREDFSGNSPVGGAPLGWTKRWNTGNMTATTVADATAEGGVAMRIDATTDSRVAITYDAVDSESPDNRDDAEILFKFKSADVDASSSYTISPLVRGSGAGGSETGYLAFVYDNNGEFRTRKYVSGVATAIQNQQDLNAHFDFDNNAWAWCRFRMNGTNMSVKIWQDYEPGPGGQHRYEPPYWQRLNDSDSSISAAGWIGIVLFATAAGPWDIAYVGIGTNGDVAPYPGGTDLQTLRLTQQTVQAAVQMEAAEVRVKQQMLQILIQENIPPPTGVKRRPIIIGM